MRLKTMAILLLVSLASGCGGEEKQLWKSSPDSKFLAYAGVWYGGTVTDPSPVVRLYKNWNLLGLRLRHDGRLVFSCTASNRIDINWKGNDVLEIATGCSSDPNVSQIFVQTPDSRGIKLRYRFEKPDYPLDFSQASLAKAKIALSKAKQK